MEETQAVAEQLDMLPEAKVDPAEDPDRRYTTPETIHWCMERACISRFDLDVAADAESHWAPRWYDVKQDGLQQPWSGRVWCNPPYSDIEPWVKKAWEEAKHCEVIAMLLPATRCEQPWWQAHVEPFRDGMAALNRRLVLDDERHSLMAPELTTHFLPGRIPFGHPGNPKAVGVGSPPFGCVLLVFSNR